MTGLAKVLVGLGVAVPVAGVAGGIYVAVTKSAVATQETQPLRTELSSTSHSVHSQQATQGSEHALQENQNLVDSRATTVSHVSDSLENPDIRVPVQSAEEEETTTGNCTIIDPLKKILEVAKQDETEYYYSVSCDNTRIGGAGEGNIPNQWEGAFPKSIFKRQDLSNDQKLEIKVKEEDDEDETFSDYDTGEDDWPYSITLSGNSFVDTDNSLISAKWDYYDDFNEEDKSVIKVKLTKPNSDKNIYLLWTKP